MVGLICNVFQCKISFKCWESQFLLPAFTGHLRSAQCSCSSAGALGFCCDGNCFSLQQCKSYLSPHFPTVPSLAVALSALVKLRPLFETRSVNLEGQSKPQVSSSQPGQPSDIVVENSSWAWRPTFTQLWHHTSGPQLALRAEIESGTWSASITSQAISRLPKAALKICPLPGGVSEQKFFTAASLELKTSRDELVQNRGSLDADHWFDFYQEDCGNQEDLERNKC